MPFLSRPRRWGRTVGLCAAVVVVVCSAPACGLAERDDGAVRPPLADHHQHLFSPTLAAVVNGPPQLLGSRQDPITAQRLIALLDEAGIGRAAVLSEAFWFDAVSPPLPVDDRYGKVRAENDWTAAQAAEYPERLVAFCSFNPLASYALDELDRCAAGQFRGLKLSFGTSGVNLMNAEHVRQVRRVFARANEHGLAIVAHVRPGPDYGAGDVRIFLDELVSAAPDVPVQVAHLWGGEGFSDEVLAALASAVSSGHPAAKNLWFDVAEVALTADGSARTLETIAARIRQIGLQRILYGSDAAFNDRLTPRQAWRQFRSEVPLSTEELAVIASNAAPYLVR